MSLFCGCIQGGVIVGAVIALDFSDAMLRQARRFARDEGLLGGDDDGATRKSSDSFPGICRSSRADF